MKRNLIVLSLIVLAGCIAQPNNSEATLKKAPPVQPPVPGKKQKKIMVAVIDTGIDPMLMGKDWICKTGHKDFTGNGLADNHGHGTHISGIIDQYAKDYVFAIKTNIPSKIDELSADYCQIIIKYYDPTVRGQDNLKNTIKSFRWAIDQKVDIINYSGGGTEASDSEQALITEALNKGIKVVVAAGNERSNIDVHKYFPAMYDKRTIIVGNLVSDKVEIKVEKKVDPSTRAITTTETITRDIASSSNYGISINTWELGTNILSRLPRGTFGYMTGTSQATAIKSGKLVREMLTAK